MKQPQQLAPERSVLLWFPHMLAVTTNSKANSRLKDTVLRVLHASHLWSDAGLPSGFLLPCAWPTHCHGQGAGRVALPRVWL